MEFRRWTCWTCCVILGVLLWFPVHIKGQNETHEAKVTPSNLYSPGYIFNLDYGPNLTYDYLVETTYPNHTLMLTMKDCEIESDRNGNCYYDILYIYDGVNDTAPLIDTFCCNVAPLPVWFTSGPFAYLVFTTDSSNNYKGFKMEFASVGPTTTSTTTTSTTSTTTTTTSTTTTPTSTSTTPTSTSTTPTSTSTTPTTGSASLPPTTARPSTVTTRNTPITTGSLTTVISGSTQAPKSGGGSDDSNSNIWILLGAVFGGVNFKKDVGPPGTVFQTNIFLDGTSYFRRERKPITSN